MKPARIQFGALSLALFLLAGASDVMAERLEQQSISESSWQFNVYIDGWLPKAPAEIFIDGNELDLPENLNKILDSMKLISELRFNVRKGPLGIFFNPIYYKGEYNKIRLKTPLEELDGKLKETVWLIDYGVSYEVARWDIGKDGNSRVVTLEPYAGLRYFWDNIKLEIEPGLIEDGFLTRKKVRTTSPIIGLKSSIQLNDNWDFLLQGDYGGFNVNNMKETYLMAGYFNYDFKMGKIDSKFYFGYRFLHLELEDKAEGVKVDVNAQGPLLGLGFSF
jgi:hypothetical protein